MALTQSSFRDPRKQFAMRVLSGFIIEGREPANVGDIVNVSLTVARDLMHSKKAEPYDPADDKQQARTGSIAPTPEAVVVRKAEPEPELPPPAATKPARSRD